VSVSPAPRRIAIVGANLAGARAAEALRLMGFDGEVLLIGEEALRPYERPPLSKEALLQPGATPLWVHAESFYADKRIELLTGQEVVALHKAPDGPFELALSGGRRRGTDAVLLATGGSPRRLGSADPAQLVHYIRRWEDTQRLRPLLIADARVVVIGSGFIGAEIASTALARGCRVTIVEALPALFPSVPSRAVSDAMAAIFLDAGAAALTGRAVTGVSGTQASATVHLDDGTNLQADVVVAGIGIEPRIELARMAGADTRRGVLVNERFETNVAGLYAAGDVCSILDGQGETLHVEHWKAAQEQGAAAAHSILGLPQPALSHPWCWSDQLGQRIEVAGSPKPGDEQLVRTISAKELCVFHLRGGRLAGVVSLNALRPMRMAMKLLDKGGRPDPAQLADSAVPINQVALLD
jgi:3-phenylpropionate/trans-cinnamate dioxygenase ferredoxin reductase subunit